MFKPKYKVGDKVITEVFKGLYGVCDIVQIYKKRLRYKYLVSKAHIVFVKHEKELKPFPIIK